MIFITLPLRFAYETRSVLYPAPSPLLCPTGLLQKVKQHKVRADPADLLELRPVALGEPRHQQRAPFVSGKGAEGLPKGTGIAGNPVQGHKRSRLLHKARAIPGQNP